MVLKIRHIANTRTVHKFSKLYFTIKTLLQKLWPTFETLLQRLFILRQKLYNMPDLTNNRKVTIPTAPIGQLVRAFNIASIRNIPNTKNEFEGKIGPGTEREPELYKSSLGTPVVANIVFQSVTYTANGITKTTQEQRYDTVLLTVNQPKRIIKTEIQGRNGTVKEYIADDDYQITINGIITGTNGKYPETEVLTLKQMLDAPVSIPVVCRYLNNLGIYNIVVEEWTFDQEPGGISKQNFTINAISDEPIELQIL